MREHVFSDEGFDVIRVEVRGDSVELSTVLCHSTQTDQYRPFARIVILGVYPEFHLVSGVVVVSVRASGGTKVLLGDHGVADGIDLGLADAHM